MKIDTTIRGFFASLVYVFGGVYSWIEGIGLNTYVLSVLTGFMAMDILLGWIKCVVVKDVAVLSSKRATKGILSKAVMFVIPVVSGLIWVAFDDKETAASVVNVQLTGLMIAEGYSCIANAYTIYTGEVLSEFDAVTFLFKRVGSKIRRLLDRIMGSDDVN